VQFSPVQQQACFWQFTTAAVQLCTGPGTLLTGLLNHTTIAGCIQDSTTGGLRCQKCLGNLVVNKVICININWHQQRSPLQQMGCMLACFSRSLTSRPIPLPLTSPIPSTASAAAQLAPKTNGCLDGMIQTVTDQHCCTRCSFAPAGHRELRLPGWKVRHRCGWHWPQPALH
jgi:hypothetical protein